jgi:hypothetical protein
MTEHNRSVNICALNHSKNKNPGTQNFVTMYLKNALHSQNVQKVLNTKQPCTKQTLKTHCSWWRNLKVGSNILYICF